MRAAIGSQCKLMNRSTVSENRKYFISFLHFFIFYSIYCIFYFFLFDVLDNFQQNKTKLINFVRGMMNLN